MECLGNVVELTHMVRLQTRSGSDRWKQTSTGLLLFCFVGLSHILQKAYPISSGLFPEAGRE